MELSRKRKRELKKLRHQAEELLEHQRDVLSHAGTVLGEAGRQARHLGDEHLRPRVEYAVDQARPVIERNLNMVRNVADKVRVATTPVVAAALASTVRSLERLEQNDASRQLRQFGETRGLIKPEKKRGGFGRFLAIAAGVAAAGAVGYALWQAFREDDDDMWVSSDD